jgi:hypothetical protein
VPILRIRLGRRSILELQRFGGVGIEGIFEGKFACGWMLGGEDIFSMPRN